MQPAPGSWAARLVPTTPLRVVVWIVALALVAGVAVLGWTWRHPGVFPEAGGWGIGGQWAVGEPMYIGMTYEDDDARGTVTIRSARANVVSDSADAEIAFFVCTVDPAARVGAIGSVRESGIREECSSLVPADGATMRLNARPTEQVVMAVTLAHEGRVHVEGIDLSYDLGWQSGTQRIGGEVNIRSKRS